MASQRNNGMSTGNPSKDPGSNARASQRRAAVEQSRSDQRSHHANAAFHHDTAAHHHRQAARYASEGNMDEAELHGEAAHHHGAMASDFNRQSRGSNPDDLQRQQEKWEGEGGATRSGERASGNRSSSRTGQDRGERGNEGQEFGGEDLDHPAPSGQRGDTSEEQTSAKRGQRA